MHIEFPDDDQALAILSDALVEEGDPLGEFLARQLAGDPALELLERHGSTWLGAFASSVEGVGDWARGRLERVVYTGPLENLKSFLGWARALRELDLRGQGPMLKTDRGRVWSAAAGRVPQVHIALPITWMYTMGGELESAGVESLVVHVRFGRVEFTSGAVNVGGDPQMLERHLRRLQRSLQQAVHIPLDWPKRPELEGFPRYGVRNSPQSP